MIVYMINHPKPHLSNDLANIGRLWRHVCKHHT